MTSASSRTNDLGFSRIKFGEECVSRILDILNTFCNQFDFRDSLVNLCSTIEANADVTNDLLFALKKSASADKFEWESKNKSIYEKIKKFNLKTSENMVLKKILTSKGKTYSIAAERSWWKTPCNGKSTTLTMGKVFYTEDT